MRTARITAIAVGILLASASTAGTQEPEPTTTTTWPDLELECTEDMECFDCTTMGNERCWPPTCTMKHTYGCDPVELIPPIAIERPAPAVPAPSAPEYTG